MASLGGARLALASEQLVVGSVPAGDQLDQAIISHGRVCVRGGVDQPQFVPTTLQASLDRQLDPLVARGAQAIYAEERCHPSCAQFHRDAICAYNYGGVELLKSRPHGSGLLGTISPIGAGRNWLDFGSLRYLQRVLHVDA